MNWKIFSRSLDYPAYRQETPCIAPAVAAAAVSAIPSVIGGILNFFGSKHTDSNNLQIARETNLANQYMVADTNVANYAMTEATNRANRQIAEANNIAMLRNTYDAARYNRELWQEQFNMENQYNSPAAQAARMLAAGLNPASITSAESSMGFGAGMEPAPVDTGKAMTAPTFQASHDEPYFTQNHLQAALQALDVVSKDIGVMFDNSYKKERYKYDLKHALLNNKLVAEDINLKKAAVFAAEQNNEIVSLTKDNVIKAASLQNQETQARIDNLAADKAVKGLQKDAMELEKLWKPYLNYAQFTQMMAAAYQATESIAVAKANNRLGWSTLKATKEQFFENLKEIKRHNRAGEHAANIGNNVAQQNANTREGELQLSEDKLAQDMWLRILDNGTSLINSMLPNPSSFMSR